MLIAMVGIGVICALGIVLTFETTLPIIKKNRAEALEKAIFKVIPNTSMTKTFQLTDKGLVEVAEKTDGGEFLFAGYNKKNELTGVAVEAAGQGYADVIRILYGYDPVNEKVIGFYVLETKETPGLGDKIEKDDNFLANFIALDVALSEDKKTTKNTVITVKSGEKKHPWQVEGITGATISSRAIGDIFGSSTQYWMPIIQQYKNMLLINPNTSTNEKP